MSKRTKEAQKHLQQKREQYHRQEEKIEEMKCTMQHTEEEIKQLEYVLEVMKSAEKGRKRRVITHDKIKEYFASELADSRGNLTNNTFSLPTVSLPY